MEDVLCMVCVCVVYIVGGSEGMWKMWVCVAYVRVVYM